MVPDSVSASEALRLRGFRESDVDAMYALDVVCFEPPFRFSREMIRQSAEARNACVVVGERAGRMVGFAVLHVEMLGRMRVGYVVTLDVAPEERRRGAAAAMMQRLEMDAREQGCAEMLLHVHTGNEGAIHFYRRMEFERTGLARDFYRRGLDAWVYRKVLAP